MKEKLLQVCAKSIKPKFGEHCSKMRHLYWHFLPIKKPVCHQLDILLYKKCFRHWFSKLAEEWNPLKSCLYTIPQNLDLIGRGRASMWLF